jgi:hypothetical protein
LTRTDAALGAGLSEHQQKTAMRVHNVPREQFEQLVEGDDPPTVTKLADVPDDQGRHSTTRGYPENPAEMHPRKPGQTLVS